VSLEAPDVVYHLARLPDWRRSETNGAPYYPPTYTDDGFVHATAVPALLLEVANHFYRDVPEAFVCLRMRIADLEAAGTPVVFEAPAPVGDRPADFDTDGVEVFPHLYGGIPPGAVHAVHPVTRDSAGTFVAIVGVT